MDAPQQVWAEVDAFVPGEPAHAGNSRSVILLLLGGEGVERSNQAGRVSRKKGDGKYIDKTASLGKRFPTQKGDDEKNCPEFAWNRAEKKRAEQSWAP